MERVSRRKKANLKRDSALVAGLFDNASATSIVLKPKAISFLHFRRIGIAQMCNAAFYCNEACRESLERHLRDFDIEYRISN